LADFGLSKIIAPDDPTRKGKIGTPIYMAPELLACQMYDRKVDVYAFAILAFEILSGVDPFPDIANPIAIGILVKHGGRPFIPAAVPRRWAKLIKRCWAQKASARPDFEEVSDLVWGDKFIPPECDTETVAQYRTQVLVPPGWARQNTEVDTLRATFRTETTRMRQSVARLREENRTLRQTADELWADTQRTRQALEQHDIQISSFQTDFTNTELHLITLMRDGEDLVKLVESAHTDFDAYAKVSELLRKRLAEDQESSLQSRPECERRQRP
jgi:serine/threonine protein kinase